MMMLVKKSKIGSKQIDTHGGEDEILSVHIGKGSE
jgi:hypothetical protein